MKFRSLTEARAVRDRLAAIAVSDGIAIPLIERICRSENCRRLIKETQHERLMRWPELDLTYLDKLGDAVEYIRLAELSAVTPVPFPLDSAWACACVKRDENGALSHIKLNSSERSRCPVCGATQRAARNT